MRGVRRKILESCLEIAALQVNEADELLKKQADLLVNSTRKAMTRPQHDSS
jgi:hypothetical protein